MLFDWKGTFCIVLQHPIERFRATTGEEPSVVDRNEAADRHGVNRFANSNKILNEAPSNAFHIREGGWRPFVICRENGVATT